MAYLESGIVDSSGLLPAGEFADAAEHSLSEAAEFLAKFLLRILNEMFEHLSAGLKFNAGAHFATGLSASTGTPLLRDFQINSLRDLNHMQHLLVNYMLFLMYIVSSGSFGKLAVALSALVCNRARNADTTRSRASTGRPSRPKNGLSAFSILRDRCTLPLLCNR